jgi:tetraacyldisaccharide 4'-kinase
MNLFRLILLPISLLYGAVLWTRNRLYDAGLLKSSRGDLRTIVVGNLSLGGTGKTPHTLAILKNLNSQGVKVALLSRGYGRVSRGFKWVETEAVASQVGDEPLLIKKRLPQIPVAVCENRVKGIAEIKKHNPEIEWVVLDDAFQHRGLKGDIYILLSEFNKPFFKDWTLPTGFLRDHIGEWKRAHTIIATKSPEVLTSAEKEAWKSKAVGAKSIPVYFSRISYGRPVHVFDGSLLESKRGISLGMAAIAHPQAFENHLRDQFSLKKFKSYPDHYLFNTQDIALLKKEFDTFTGPLKVILTTEKDAARLREHNELKNLPIYFVPIEIEVEDADGKDWMTWLKTSMANVK